MEKKAKFKIGDNVRLVKGYHDGSDGEWVERSLNKTGKVSSMFNYNLSGSYKPEWCDSGVEYSVDGFGLLVDESMIELCENLVEDKQEQQFSLNNTKINVAAYAEKYNITLEQAHNEIQPWLFEQGFKWDPSCNNVKYKASAYLFCNDEWRELSYGNDYGEDYFGIHKNKEITFDRQLTLVPQYAPVTKETIDIDGRQYDKEAVMAAIGQFEIK